MIPEPGAIEDDLFNARALGALGDQLVDLLGLVGLLLAGSLELLSRLEAAARVLPLVSSITWAWILLRLRKTARRGRSGEPERRSLIRSGRSARCPAAGDLRHRAIPSSSTGSLLPLILPALPALRRMTSPM